MDGDNRMNELEIISCTFACCSLLFSLFVFGVFEHKKNTIKNSNIQNERKKRMNQIYRA